MRKYILSSLLGLFIGACPSFGQHKVIITLNDGTTIEKYVWQVKDITFGEVSPIVVPQPDETTAVDLGLSVKWASFNIGASSEEEKGLLLGWGDITGLNTSRDLNYFPSLYPKGDIVNTKYDFVKTSWGDKWRLPSTKETQELIDKCTWTAVEDENQKVKGYMVTGPNGNHIFLPAYFMYRTSSLDTTYPTDECAYSLQLYKGSTYVAPCNPRISPLPVRPVAEK